MFPAWLGVDLDSAELAVVAAQHDEVVDGANDEQDRRDEVSVCGVRVVGEVRQQLVEPLLS